MKFRQTRCRILEPRRRTDYHGVRIQPRPLAGSNHRETVLTRNARQTCSVALIVALMFALSAASASATDWPQWMGLTRDGNYTETGVIERIPAEGLPIKWRKPINGGYSGPAVANGHVYVMDFIVTKGKVVNTPDGKPEIEGIERVLCLDEKTGNEVWKFEYPASYRISYPGGPRCTPTVVGDWVVTLGSHGDLCVLNAKDGKLKWRTSFEKDHKAPVPLWGFAGHPLVADGIIYVLIGGKDQALAAFDLQTGDLKWKSLSSKHAGYCPPVMIEAGGTQQLVVWHPEALVSVNPRDGKPYWQIELKPTYEMSIGRPQRQGDMLYTSGIYRAATMLKLDNKKPAVTEIWRGDDNAKSLYPGNVTPMWGENAIFGCDHRLGALIAIDPANGERLWQTFEPVDPKEDRKLPSGSAFITRHTPSGNYFLFGETGNLSLAKMDRAGYHSLGSVNIVKPTTNAFGRDVVWSHPAYANRTVYLRNDKEIVAVDIAK